MKTTLLCVITLFSLSLDAQSTRLSLPEFRWAIFHPVAAIKVKKISNQCTPVFSEIIKSGRLDKFSSGGNQDAFRHVFYMAAFSSVVKAKKIIKLGAAHEKANYRAFKKHRLEDGETPDSLSTTMDLKNNELGVSIGKRCRNMTTDSIAVKCLNEIFEGGAFMLKRNAKGEFTDCTGKVIDLAQYKGSWYIPKCLVRTNQKSED